MRIGIAGFHHETNTFSPVKTTYEDFHKTRAEELLKHPAWEQLRRAGHSLHPTLQARARPSGPVTKACYERITSEIASALADCLPLDALFLILHGAMEVERIGNGEGALVQDIHTVIGEDVFVCGTLDLHGNLSEEFVRSCEFLTALRTAPHRDETETQRRGIRLMKRCLEEGIQPITEFVQLPLLLAGEHAVTEVEPARSLYRQLSRLDSAPGILTCSIMIGCPWTDSPDTGVSVMVSGTDEEEVHQTCRNLAGDVWDRRADFTIDTPFLAPEKAIEYALSSPQRPVFLSDSGDNVTAGGAGDNAFLLQRFIELNVSDVLVAGIVDTTAVEKCMQASEEREIVLKLGAGLDPELSEACRVQAVVKRVLEDEGRVLVVVDDIHVLLQADRRAVRSVGELRRFGVEPSDFRIIVVKLGLLLPGLRDYAPAHVLALTPGCTDLRLKGLPFERIRRPIYPLDPDLHWSPE